MKSIIDENASIKEKLSSSNQDVVNNELLSSQVAEKSAQITTLLETVESMNNSLAEATRKITESETEVDSFKSLLSIADDKIETLMADCRGKSETLQCIKDEYMQISEKLISLEKGKTLCGFNILERNVISEEFDRLSAQNDRLQEVFICIKATLLFSPKKWHSMEFKITFYLFAKSLNR